MSSRNERFEEEMNNWFDKNGCRFDKKDYGMIVEKLSEKILQNGNNNLNSTRGCGIRNFYGVGKN